MALVFSDDDGVIGLGEPGQENDQLLQDRLFANPWSMDSVTEFKAKIGYDIDVFPPQTRFFFEFSQGTLHLGLTRVDMALRQIESVCVLHD